MTASKRTLVIRASSALFVLFAVAIAALAASRYTVTATLYNTDAASNPLIMQSDGASSAVYSSQSQGVDSELTPHVNGAGVLFYQWTFNLSTSSRSVYLTLVPLDANSPQLFSGSQPFAANIYSRCFTSSGALQNWTQIQYSDNNCGMRVAFFYAGTSYQLLMSPDEPGSGTATVTCTNWSPSSNSCSAWTDVPTAGNPNSYVAHLYHQSTLIGTYQLTFNLSLAHP